MAVVRVLFFASLRDAVGNEELRLSIDEPVSVDGLLSQLAERLPADAMAALRAENVRLAVNQNLVSGKITIAPGDEVAFLPPVTGG